MDVRWVETISFETPPRRTVRGAGDGPKITTKSSRPYQLAGVVMEFAGVLYDDTAWQRWLLQQLARIGLQTQYGPFFQVFERDYLPAVHCGRDYWDALREFLVASGLTRGQIDEVEVAGLPRYRQFEEGIRPLPGVASTLSQLAAFNVPAVVLSNTQYTAAELERRLRKMGLADRFVAVLSSRESGHRMPDEASYEAALTAIRLPPRAVAFVGKNEYELKGAARAGMTTVAINHEPGTRADILIDRFDQLLRAVCLQSSAKMAG